LIIFVVELFFSFTSFFYRVPVSSNGKISDGCIRDLGFNLRL